MATLQQYMRGQEQAKVEKGNAAGWLNSPPTILKLTNKAFKLYYNAWQGTKDAPLEIRTKINMDLTNAARTGVGWGFGVGDLEACFQHLIDNNNHWKNVDGKKNYAGPQVSGAINLPTGITNFLNAVDNREEALKKSYNDCSKYLIELARAKKNKNWEKIGDYSGKLEKTLWWGTPFIWITSLSANEVTTGYHERVSKWNDAFGLVHSFLDTFNKYNDLGTTKAEAVGIAALATLIKKGVPILGDAYAKVFDALPGAIKWARNVRQEQDRQIRAILGAGNW